MKTSYQISLNMKNAQSVINIGCFYLGNDRRFAENIFKLLTGASNISEKTVLFMELTSLMDEIQLPLAIRHCTLEQLTLNTQIITKELFKQYTLKDED